MSDVADRVKKIVVDTEVLDDDLLHPIGDITHSL